jgi:sporulation protein YlmC with PRC-barrel domain
MRLSDLRDKKIKTTDGEVLGRIHEVHSDKGKIVALMCGPSSMIERWTARHGGHRIPWTSVRKIERDAVIVTIEPTAKG